ncbi:aldehyde dehydrogenase family protein [Marinobacterium aestuariivivens]|uniref:Aldehyde dehydrogenase family protein n=1 Tax=Marinobacterium aestuariivivens TaxID=1698799 RepID=A0ABW1ZW51_9GAMM
MSQIEVFNPFTGERVFSQPSETFEAMCRRIDDAQKAARAWRKLDPTQRAEQIQAALDYFRLHRDAIAGA